MRRNRPEERWIRRLKKEVEENVFIFVKPKLGHREKAKGRLIKKVKKREGQHRNHQRHIEEVRKFEDWLKND